MTRKETALENLRKAVEEFNSIGDYNIYINNVISEARKKRISEIEEKTEYYKNQTQHLILKNQIKEYFESPEGALKKEAAEKRQEVLHEDHVVLAVETSKRINEALKIAGVDIFPYAVGNIMNNRWTLENQESTKKYWLRIEINFLKDYWNNGEINPGINVSAIGTIPMLKPSEGRSYYMVIGKLFENSEKVLEVFNKFCGDDSEYIQRKNELAEEQKKISDWLNNPLKEVA